MRFFYSLIFSLVITLIITLFFGQPNHRGQTGKNLPTVKIYWIEFVKWFIPVFIIILLFFYLFKP